MTELELKYGCNPNQKPAKIFMQSGGDLPIQVLNGRPGFINFLDAFNSWQLVKELKEATGLPVALWDERRTTVDAHRILGEQGVRAKNRKDKIDSVAATLILEGYLDWKRLQAQRQEREEETP